VRAFIELLQARFAPVPYWDRGRVAVTE
jgi:hypothetical protein